MTLAAAFPTPKAIFDINAADRVIVSKKVLPTVLTIESDTVTTSEKLLVMDLTNESDTDIDSIKDLVNTRVFVNASVTLIVSKNDLVILFISASVKVMVSESALDIDRVIESTKMIVSVNVTMDILKITMLSTKVTTSENVLEIERVRASTKVTVSEKDLLCACGELYVLRSNCPTSNCIIFF